MSDLKNVSDEEFQAEMIRRQKRLKKLAKDKKQQYEDTREQVVRLLVSGANDMQKLLIKFKQDAFDRMIAFQETAKEYGDVRTNSQGGYGLRTKDGCLKVVLERNTKVEYDERATQAEALIKEFLSGKIKKRDAEMFELVTALLERGKNNEFNPANIATLLKKADLYNDERWVRAMTLFTESHNIILIGMNVSFYMKDKTNKDQPVVLTMSSLPVNDKSETESQSS